METRVYYLLFRTFVGSNYWDIQILSSNGSLVQVLDSGYLSQATFQVAVDSSTKSKFLLDSSVSQFQAVLPRLSTDNFADVLLFPQLPQLCQRTL